MQEQEELKYQNQYTLFKQIQEDKRQEYYQKVFSIQRTQINPPRLYFKQYPDHGEFKIQNHKLYYHKIQNTNKPKAIIIHFHGLNSHGATSGYYANIICSNNKDVNMYALDQINFGRSEGDCRGYIRSLANVVKYGQAFVDFLLQKNKQKPKIFLSGSSFGGTVAIRMSINQPTKYSGLILLAPALRDISQSKAFLKKFNRFLTWIAPRAHLPLPTSSKDSTKYNCDQFIKNDQYYYQQGLVPGSISAVLDGMNEISKLFGSVSNSYILFQGGVDKSSDLFAPIDLEKESSAKDKTTIYYKNLWHSVFYEEQIYSISRQASQWIKNRIK